MGVTKNTLFHYDKIGLFSPDIVRENEYRYYSVYQMELFHTIPAGDFLTAYHTGHWNTIGDCYERLLTYAKKHHLKLDHCFWEYYAIDNLHTPDSDQYVTELSVRILES